MTLYMLLYVWEPYHGMLCRDGVHHVEATGDDEPGVVLGKLFHHACKKENQWCSVTHKLLLCQISYIHNDNKHSAMLVIIHGMAWSHMNYSNIATLIADELTSFLAMDSST